MAEGGTRAIGDIEESVNESPATTRRNAQIWMAGVVGLLLIYLIIDAITSRGSDIKKPKTLQDTEASFEKRDVEKRVSQKKISQLKESADELEKKVKGFKEEIDYQKKFKEARDAYYYEMRVAAMKSYEKTEVSYDDKLSKMKKQKTGKAQGVSTRGQMLEKLNIYHKDNSDTMAANQPESQKTTSQKKNLIIDTFEGDQNGYLMPAATVMNLSMQQDVISDYQGPFSAILNNDVYNNDRTEILIPKGIEVLGQARQAKQINEIIQGRLLLVAEWAVLPDGRQIRITNIGDALDREGVAAIPGDTNYHWGWKLFGAGAVALVNTFGSYEGTGANQDASFAGNASQNAREVTSREANKYLDLVPTVVVKFGDIIKFRTTMGVKLPSWGRVNDY